MPGEREAVQAGDTGPPKSANAPHGHSPSQTSLRTAFNILVSPRLFIKRFFTMVSCHLCQWRLGATSRGSRLKVMMTFIQTLRFQFSLEVFKELLLQPQIHWPRMNTSSNTENF